MTYVKTKIDNDVNIYGFARETLYILNSLLKDVKGNIIFINTLYRIY